MPKAGAGAGAGAGVGVGVGVGVGGMGNLPPIIAAWIPDIVFAFVALWLYKKAPK